MIYRTDYNGDIKITSNGYRWDIFYDRPNDEPFPPTIGGPTTGEMGLAYEFSVQGSDPNQDEIYYKLDWCDGDVTNWLGPYESGEKIFLTHVWEEGGAYIIKVKAKDIYEQESEWGTFNVVMPRNKDLFKQEVPRLTRLLECLFLKIIRYDIK
jgi:hypothetical protein